MKRAITLPLASTLHVFLLLAISALSSPVWAMPEGLEESVADVAVWIVIIVVPIGAVYLFWKVHILPEIVAERNHHPQKGAIKALCLLSLIFGGLLWPIAWLWAFTKPVSYKMAYGTDKHDDYFLKPDDEHSTTPRELAIVEDELLSLQEKIDGLNKKREQLLSQQKSKVVEAKNA